MNIAAGNKNSLLSEDFNSNDLNMVKPSSTIVNSDYQIVASDASDKIGTNNAT